MQTQIPSPQEYFAAIRGEFNPLADQLAEKHAATLKQVEDALNGRIPKTFDVVPGYGQTEEEVEGHWPSTRTRVSTDEEAATGSIHIDASLPFKMRGNIPRQVAKLLRKMAADLVDAADLVEDVK